MPRFLSSRVFLGGGGVVLATLGVLAATPFASADGVIPTVSVTVPGVTTVTVTTPTVSLPVGGSTASTTTAPTTTAAGGSPGSGSSGPAGSGGSSSTTGTTNRAKTVAAETVRPPSRLQIAKLQYTPRVVRSEGTLKLSMVIRDNSGHLVRGAVVLLQPGRGLATSKADGTASVTVRLPRMTKQRATFVLRVRSPFVSTSKTLRLHVARH